MPDLYAKSWLGPHLLVNGNQDATQWIARGRPSVVKLVDTDIPGEFPGLDIAWVGRHFENEFDPNNPFAGGFSDDPKIAAQQYVARFLDGPIRAKPRIALWELNNEPVITVPERMTWYAKFLSEGARLLRVVYNKTAVIGNWSVGNPEFELWAHYVPALEAVLLYGAILGRHSYGPLNDYFALRHRRDNDIFAAMGYPDFPVVIGECGADSVNSPDGPNQPWKAYYGGDVAAYVQYLSQLEAEFRADARYVVGGAVFTYGMGWDAFNLNDSGAGQTLGDQASGLPLTRIPLTASAPPPDQATHVVMAEVLNVRAWPWIGDKIPPIVRTLSYGTRVVVNGLYAPYSKAQESAPTWACVGQNGNEWCSARWLTPIG